MSDTLKLIVTAAGALVGSFLLAYIIRYILRTTAIQAAKRSKSPFDDVIIKALERSVMLVLCTAGVYIAVLIALRIEFRGLSSAQTTAYVAKTHQIFKAAFTIIIARSLLILLNGTAHLYIINAETSGMAARIRILRKLIMVGTWSLVVVLVLGQMGYKVSAILATLGVAGLAVALALQDILSNIFAGFYIVADRSVRAGDYIRLDTGEEGFVEEVSWRNTRIRLWENNLVIVPNAKLMQSVIINCELPQQELSVYIPCGVSYNSDLEHVERVTVDVATDIQKTVPDAVREHEPVVRFKEFGDSNINFIVVLRSVNPSGQYFMKHEFIKRLHRRYKEEGIDISYPVRTIISSGNGHVRA